MTPPLTRRRTPDSADVRRRILDAATALFARDGFDATATSAVARAAGVPKGLLFYHFPTKIDLLRNLLAERLPASPLCGVASVVVPGDIAASLVALHAELGLDQHQSLVLRIVVFREAQTHPEVGEHVRRLRAGLVAVTEEVLDAASVRPLGPEDRRSAARTFVAVVLDHANAERFGGAESDIEGAARLLAGGLYAGQRAR